MIIIIGEACWDPRARRFLPLLRTALAFLLLSFPWRTTGFVATVPPFVAPSKVTAMSTMASKKSNTNRLQPLHQSSSSMESDENLDNNHDKSKKEGSTAAVTQKVWQTLAASISQRAAVQTSDVSRQRSGMEIKTLLRVGIPSVAAGLAAYFLFPVVSLYLASVYSEAGALTVLSIDSSQFVQNFLGISSLLFAILVGQTYYFMYTQQESVYYALFHEVTEAKSLLEQVALVCQGRNMYSRCLESISKYVQEDLKALKSDPAKLLSARPVDDPLESIMYMTSVGVPSTVYETVKSLRAARAARLGALQRKLPAPHLAMLWTLAAVEIVSFPLLGAGTQVIGGYNILTVEGCLFGVMTTGIVLTLRVVGELWRPAGGAYNVDAVLSVMVSGLESELQARMDGAVVKKAYAPSPASITEEQETSSPTL